MPRKPIVDVHCHLFNFKFLPDRMIKLLSHIPEDLGREHWFGAILGFLAALYPGKSLDRIHHFLETLDKPIDEVTSAHLAEMNAAKIDICTPLLMDFEPTVGRAPDDYAYEEQIDLISEQAAKYPWRIFPFVMFDPRRPNALALCREAIEEKGFIGVKMYPALGYAPIPLVEVGEVARENLLGFYDWYDHYYKETGVKLPITVHTATGGAYKPRDPAHPARPLANNVNENTWRLTDPSNWHVPLAKYQLRLNFAHFGGDYLNPDPANRAQSDAWRREILNLIRLSREAEQGEVYADLSYNDMALRDDIRGRYFQDLRAVLDSPAKERILFGTDACMISHTWSEKEYCAPFRKHLDPEMQERIFTANPVRFLFGPDAKVPKNYVDFLERKGKLAAGNLPEWVETKDGGYRIFTG